MLRTETGLYHALCEALKVANRPLTCSELFDMPAIRKYATNANRVSDYLGNLWRDRKLKRVPAPRTEYSSARWAYSWKAPRKNSQIPVPQIQLIELPEYTITISITPRL